MKNLIIFICGCIVGAIVTYSVFGFGTRQNTNKSADSEIMVNEPTIEEPVLIDPTNSESNVQYIDIRGKKGDVVLYTGMTKDSVKTLLGKPDEVNLYSVFEYKHEIWGYKIKNHYSSDLEIEFIDGKLVGVQQY